SIHRFVGERYYFDARGDSTFRAEDRTDNLRGEVRGLMGETDGRAGYFLTAVITLYHEGMWDRHRGGATWTDILRKMSELGSGYPAPRDIAIIKSYRIYYKTGSNRYPTHTVPEEMIPTIEEELKGRF
ncbi:MAG: hypothetical protein ACE5KH_04150, partial [Candidatus Geothermarchaeales archaeon]